MATNFTLEQLQDAKAAKSPAELIEKAKEQGIDITLEQASAFLDGQASEISDEELDNVAGGACCEQTQNEKWKEAAAAEGRTIFCEVVGINAYARCDFCFARSSLYARQKEVRKNGYDLYKDVKCYNCGRLCGNVSTADR